MWLSHEALWLEALWLVAVSVQCDTVYSIFQSPETLEISPESDIGLPLCLQFFPQCLTCLATMLSVLSPMP